jgi:hypothetical protein
MASIETFQDLVKLYNSDPVRWKNQFQNALNSYGKTHGISFAANATVDNIVVTSISTNNFPQGTSLFVLPGPAIIYTGETIKNLADGYALPANKYVSWAALGAPAGTLLTNLGRKENIYSAKSMIQYTFQAVRLVNGPTSEGVGGSAADIDPFESGWICVWAAQGTPAIL